ncbi:UNVERIFIED_CONTAM: hypothetical protein FKN15_010087 [Acipenser sinensis]
MLPWQQAVVTRLIHLLGQKILGNLQQVNGPLSARGLGLHSSGSKWDAGNPASNLSTVTILPVSEEVPMTAFTLELQHALEAIGPTLLLTSDSIKQRLGSAALDSVHEYRLSSWLGQQEDIHRIVLYQSDSSLTPWTQRCIRQADCILIVGLGDQEPTVGGDLWIPYFNITTDIIASAMRVHTGGSLWRYVRASMSLSGYLPPLCDPKDGHLLMDGGYINNLPDWLPVRFVLCRDSVQVLDMAEIQTRLAYMCCVRQLEMVKSSEYCEYIQPPIDLYGTLDFGKFNEILEVGYQHGQTLFDVWRRSGVVDKMPKDRHQEEFHKTKTKTSDEVGYQHGQTLFDVWCRSGVVDKMPKDRHQEEFHKTKTKTSDVVTCPNASFTDLAEIVSRIESVKPAVVDDESDYQTDYEEEATEALRGEFKPSNQNSEHTEEEETCDTDHEHATFEDILEEIEKKLNIYRKGCKIWKMLIFCQGGPGHLYLLKNKVATFAKVEKEEDMILFWKRLSRLMSKINPEPDLIHIMGCYVLGNANGEKAVVETYFDFRLYRLWKTHQHSKLLDYDDIL